MQQTDLEAKRAAIEARFNELADQKEAITQEMYRLQGENRLIGELLINLSKEEKTPRGTKSGRTEKPTE